MQQLKASSSEVSVARTSCDVHLKDTRSKGVFLARFGFRGAARSHFACGTLQSLATCSFLYWGLCIYTLVIACFLFFPGSLDGPRKPVFQFILVACSPSSHSSAFLCPKSEFPWSCLSDLMPFAVGPWSRTPGRESCLVWRKCVVDTRLFLLLKEGESYNFRWSVKNMISCLSSYCSSPCSPLKVSFSALSSATGNLGLAQPVPPLTLPRKATSSCHWSFLYADRAKSSSTSPGCRLH